MSRPETLLLDTVMATPGYQNGTWAQKRDIIADIVTKLREARVDRLLVSESVFSLELLESGSRSHFPIQRSEIFPPACSADNA